MRARRALLYTPGDDLYKIQKASTLGVDCICMDMEDGVALNRKTEARQTIAQALNSIDFGRSERLARINPVGSGLERDDLETVLPAHPDGIVIPKVEFAEQIQWVSQVIERYEKSSGWNALCQRQRRTAHRDTTPGGCRDGARHHQPERDRLR